MINSMNQMEKVVTPYIRKAMELTRDRIFEVVSQKVSDYYNERVFSPPDEDEPDFYNRTGRLMESLSATHIEQSGNTLSFRVGWDDDYLTFRYPGGFVKKGSFGSYNKATGLQVLGWMDSQSHGGTVSGEHSYWTEAINELGGQVGLMKLFKDNCKTVGLPLL